MDSKTDTAKPIYIIRIKITPVNHIKPVFVTKLVGENENW